MSLDEVSLDRFTAQPSQETEVWEKEKTEILQRVKKRLTKWERQLLDWLLAGLAEEEIARKRGVRVETIYQAKNRLIKKLRWLIGELREKKMIFLSRFSVLEAL